MQVFIDYLLHIGQSMDTLLSLLCVSVAGSHVTVNGIECINLATFNFLGLLEHTNVKVRGRI